MIASPGVLEKAARLVDENRVVLSRRNTNCAMVCGDHEHYEVWATPTGLTCECYAGTHGERYCAHMVAAMVAWQERAEAMPFSPPFVPAERATGFAALVNGPV